MQSRLKFGCAGSESVRYDVSEEAALAFGCCERGLNARLLWLVNRFAVGMVSRDGRTALRQGARL